jgi:hypothetical protein
MNPKPTDQAPSSNDLTPSQNPQSTGQVLSASTTSNNLQSATQIQGANQPVSITSVGDSSFTPFSGSTTSNVASTAPKPLPVNTHYTLIGLAVVAVVASAVYAYMMTIKSRAEQRKR